MNVELNDELTRLGIARNVDLAKDGAAVAIGAKTSTGSVTNVQAALDALKLALDDSSETQQQALEDLTTTIEQANTVTNRAISEIQQQLGNGSGGGGEMKSFTNNSTIAAGSSVILAVGQSTKPLLLYKLATAITQATAKNLDVTLSVNGNVLYRAESLAKSIDSTFPLFTDYVGAITLTLANQSADSCDVAVKVFWSEQ